MAYKNLIWTNTLDKIEFSFAHSGKSVTTTWTPSNLVVSELIQIRLIKAPNNLVYGPNENIDLSGCELEFQYNNGKNVTVKYDDTHFEGILFGKQYKVNASITTTPETSGIYTFNLIEEFSSLYTIDLNLRVILSTNFLYIVPNDDAYINIYDKDYNFPKLEYSIDLKEWNPVESAYTHKFSANQPVYYRSSEANLSPLNTESIIYQFYVGSNNDKTNDINFMAFGNIVSLIDKFGESTSVPFKYCFYRLFYNCSNLYSIPTLLSTNLAEYCYAEMFMNCSSLYITRGSGDELIFTPSLSLSTTSIKDIFKGTIENTEIVTGFSYYQTSVNNFNYLTFTANEPNSTILLDYRGTISDFSLEYSSNKLYWIEYALNTTIPLTNRNEKIYFRRKRTDLASQFSINTDNFLYFKTTGTSSLSASGNVMSLVDKTCKSTKIPNNYCFYSLFAGANITTPPELPATTLSEGCYYFMFSRSKIASIPKLPATTLANYCYNSMFENCTNITSLNEVSLPATTLSNSCYAYMFEECTNLKTVSNNLLPATILGTNSEYCYAFMFNTCSNLTTIPNLPATSLSAYCYYRMFKYCKNLTTPMTTLPAMKLEDHCYTDMFSDCTNLSKIPSLPATTLADHCYDSMFANSPNVETPAKLPALNLKLSCYSMMFYGCSKIKMSTAQTEAYSIPYRIPTSGTGSIATNWNDMMFSYTGGTFTGSPSINTTYYLYDNNYSPTLKFTAKQANDSIALMKADSRNTYDPGLEYRTNNINWTVYTVGNSITLPNIGDWVCFRRRYDDVATKFSWNSLSYFFYFTTSVDTKVSGNIMGLIDKSCTTTRIPSDYCFYSLFQYTKISDASELKLSATALAYSCYTGMFYNCTSLVKPPALPATTLATCCYESMFYNCTSLTTAPVLPATTLADFCYDMMFYKCTSLTTAPALPATKLADACYSEMFFECSKLTIPPILPATTLTNYCYDSMFYGCSNLKVKTGISTGSGTKFFTCPSTSGLDYPVNDMFYGTSGTFRGTPSAGASYYYY